jgi:arylformamidase
MKTVILSYPIENNSPHYIGTTEPSLEPLTQIKNGDDYNTYKITVGNHSGTHIDAPKHFVDTGRSISDYSPEELSFKNPIVLDCPKNPYELIEIKDISDADLDKCECLLFKTGFGKFRETDLQKYLTKSPGIAVETVDWIREGHPQIRCLGIDTISMSRYQDAENAKQTHITGFKTSPNYGEPLLFIEDMNLDMDEELTIKEVMVVPWQIKGVDSTPCTVIGFVNHK